MMKLSPLFFFSCLLMAKANAYLLSLDHLPEERNYNSNVAADRGYTQYGAPDLHYSNQYVLTYDDGPSLLTTPKILDLLKQHKVKATFFVVASQINSQNEFLIKRMLDEGHIVGSHDWAHTNSNNESEAVFKQGLKDSIVKIYHLHKKFGRKMFPIYYRFPYAAYGENRSYHHMNIIRQVSYELFQENCIHFAFWDHDSTDWVYGLTPQTVFNNMRAFQEGGTYVTYQLVGPERLIKPKTTTIENPQQGGIILLHDIQVKTVEATRLYLDYAKTAGLEIVPLNSAKDFDYEDDQKCELK